MQACHGTPRHRPRPTRPRSPGWTRIAGWCGASRRREFAGVTFTKVPAKSALNRVPTSLHAVSVDPMARLHARVLHVHARSLRLARSRCRHDLLHPDCGQDQCRRGAAPPAPRSRRKGAPPAGHQHRPSPARRSTSADARRSSTRWPPSGRPFSILTKGTLMRRDLALLEAAAAGRCRSASACPAGDPGPEAAREPRARHAEAHGPDSTWCSRGDHRPRPELRGVRGAGAPDADRHR